MPREDVVASTTRGSIRLASTKGGSAHAHACLSRIGCLSGECPCLFPARRWRRAAAPLDHPQHSARCRGPELRAGALVLPLSGRPAAHRSGSHRPAVVASRLCAQGRRGPRSLQASNLCPQSAAGRDLSQELWRLAQKRPRRCLLDRRTHSLWPQAALAFPARYALCPAATPDPLSLPSGSQPGARKELLPELPVSDLLLLWASSALQRPVWRD